MSAADLLTHSQDHILLAGQRSPGIAHVEGAELTRRLHERRAFGVAGATVIDQGGELAHFSVRLELLTVADMNAWDTWKEILVRPAQRSTQGQSIEHPILADLGIAEALLEGRSQLTQDDTGGGWSVTIKFIEFRRPVPALAVPLDTSATPPQTELERQIAAGTAELADQDRRLAA